MSKLHNFKYLTDQFYIHMQVTTKSCFHEGARERFKKLFFIKQNEIPEFFKLTNKAAVFFYMTIMDKYNETVKYYNNGVKYCKIYKLNSDGSGDNQLIENIYRDMLEYYNNIIVSLLNEIKPSPYKNYIFKTLPNTFI